jgi:hypothetical protein
MPLARKQGLCGRPAQTTRLMGRGWPKLWAACGMLWRRKRPACGEPAGRSLRHLVVAFDAGLPCFLGGSLQEPLGPMHFCCQDDGPRHAREKVPEKGRNILHVIFACMK